MKKVPKEIPAELQFYNTQQVADMFKVTPYTVRTWIHDKKLKAIPIGNAYRISHTEIVRFAQERYPE